MTELSTEKDFIKLYKKIESVPPVIKSKNKDKARHISTAQQKSIRRD